MWGTVGPTISFLERDGAAWRYQRKIAGARKHFCLPEAEMRPGTPPSVWEAPSPSQSPLSKKKGFTGEHGSPVKSRAARGAVPHCISAEMPRFWWGRPFPQAQLAKSPRPRPWRKLSSPSAGEPRFPAEARKTIPQDAAAPRITKAPGRPPPGRGRKSASCAPCRGPRCPRRPSPGPGAARGRGGWWRRRCPFPPRW